MIHIYNIFFYVLYKNIYRTVIKQKIYISYMLVMSIFQKESSWAEYLVYLKQITIVKETPGFGRAQS